MEILLPLLVLTTVLGTVFLVGRSLLGRRARALGYVRIFEYLRAAPATDAQKLDAADLILKGVMLLGIGLIVTPLILVSLLPLYYGLRKLLHVVMNLTAAADVSR